MSAIAAAGKTLVVLSWCPSVLPKRAAKHLLAQAASFPTTLEHSYRGSLFNGMSIARDRDFPTILESRGLVKVDN